MSMEPAIFAMTAANLAATEQARQDSLHAARCGAFMPGYTDKGATQAARQEYASCVGLLYPAPGGGLDLPPYVGPGAAVVLVVSMLVGCAVGWDEDSSIVTAAVYALLGALLASAVMAVLGGVLRLAVS